MRKDKHAPREAIILLIDGHCNLCHSITKFVVKRDHARRFRFASLQSEAGQYLLAKGGLPLDNLDTFVMVEDERFYTKSGAALRVYREFGGLWPLLYGFMIVPKWIRNAVYDLIANNRYRWFGRTETCLLPTAELRSRFIGDLEEVSGHAKQADLR